MIDLKSLTLLVSPTLDEHALQTIEQVLQQYQKWQTMRSRIHAQIFFDFRLTEPTQDQVCDIVEHIFVFADALRLVADQIEREVEETTDQFYTWLYD